MNVKNDSRFMKILTSVSCMIILAEVSTDSEVSMLIKMVTNFKVARSNLIIAVPKLNISVFENETINFNVNIYHKGKGNLTTYNWVSIIPLAVKDTI